MSSETIHNLGELGRSLGAAVDALGDLEATSTKAESEFKVGYAKAYMNAEGSIQAREAQATIATAELRDAHEAAAAAVRVQRETLKALHARIDIGRSLLTTERHLAGAS